MTKATYKGGTGFQPVVSVLRHICLRVIGAGERTLHIEHWTREY